MRVHSPRCSTHVVMEPQVLIERLLALGRVRPGDALVPRPRRHKVHVSRCAGAWLPSMRDMQRYSG